MRFSLLITAGTLASLAIAQGGRLIPLSDNCTSDDIFNCFLSDPTATPFCISYLQIPVVTKTIVSPTAIPTSLLGISVETIDPTAVPTIYDPASPQTVSINTSPELLTQLPDDVATSTTTGSPTDDPAVDRRADKRTPSPIIPTMNPTLLGIGPVLLQSELTVPSVLIPSVTCLSQDTQTASALISSACSCLSIETGTMTVIWTAPVPTWTGMPRGGNRTDDGNGTSIADPNGRGHGSTRRQPRPTRGPHRYSSV